jgi:peptidoglycan-associated lipoprotein
MAAALAMLGLSACNSGSDTTARTADASSTVPADPTTDTKVATGGLTQNSDAVFRSEVGDTVLFATDHYDLDATAQSQLQRQAAFLMQYAEWKITVQGYADERGTREYNLALGERRAETVRGYLQALGVDPARLQTVSYGKEQPACGEASEACWERNRRGVTVLNP